MATNNNFTVIGFVAVDANVVKNNNGSAFARFPRRSQLFRTSRSVPRLTAPSWTC